MDLWDLISGWTRKFWMAGAILFFFLYSYLAFFAPPRLYNSPDEAANAYFARVFAQTGQLRVAEPLSELTGDRIRPRSITVQEGALVPESFHGLPVIYGLLSWPWARLLPFLTPIFAVLAVLAWRQIIARTFSPAAGQWAGLVLALTPAWWYWTNRGLYHNVFFVSLLIFSAYFFIVQPKRAVKINHLLSGLTLGLALWVRPAEFFWVILLAVFLWAANRKQISGRQQLGWAIAFLSALAPLFFFNAALYNHSLTTGYVLPEESRLDQLSWLWPFGFHPRLALNNFLTYFIRLPWWLTMIWIGSLLGLGYKFLRGQAEKNELALVSLFLGVTGWLVLVYGSWLIHDNPDPKAITVGISYSRYWLPAFVLASGLAGLSLARMKMRPIRVIGLILMIILMAALSARQVFFEKGDGLKDLRQTLAEYAMIKADALRFIPQEAVVIVERADKIFFPDRRVMYPLRDQGVFKILLPLSLRTSIFYYGLTLTPDDFLVQNKKLEMIGLELRPQKTYTDSTLYRIERR